MSAAEPPADPATPPGPGSASTARPANDPPVPSSTGGPARPVEGSRRPGRLRILVLARLADQGALGLGSLLLARELGPEAFAPVAVLFIVNSLAIQVSDLGLGFAVLRTAPEHHLASASVRRLRKLGGGLVAGALLVAAGLQVAGQGAVAAVVLTSGLVWALSAEGRVRKSSALTVGATAQAARAEIVGAVVFGAGVVVVLLAGGGVAAVGAAFVAKHLVEVLVVRTWAVRFAEDGVPARSGPEWLGQVMTYLVANADYVVLGLLLAPADLSRYAVAFRVASALPALVANPITQTAFLDLAAADASARQDVHDGIRRQVLRLGSVGGLAVLVAAPVLPLLLGEAWAGVGALVAVLAVAVPFRLLLGMSVAQAITVGRARAVVGWESVRLVVVAGATAVGAVAGGVLWATVGVSVATVVSIAVTYVLSARVAQVRPWSLVGPAAAVAVASAAVLGAVLA